MGLVSCWKFLESLLLGLRPQRVITGQGEPIESKELTKCGNSGPFSRCKRMQSRLGFLFDSDNCGVIDEASTEKGLDQICVLERLLT